jgi:Bacterial capsule synthesis protein PGA_cap
MNRLALAGDVMLGRGVNGALEGLGPEEPWGDVPPLLRSADLRIVNLECAITAHDRPWNRTPKTFHFRAEHSRAAGVPRGAT